MNIKTEKGQNILGILVLLFIAITFIWFVNDRFIKPLKNNSEVQYQPTKIDTVIYDITENKYYYHGKQIEHFNPSESGSKEKASVITEIKNTLIQICKKYGYITLIGLIISIISLIAIVIFTIFVLMDSSWTKMIFEKDKKIIKAYISGLSGIAVRVQKEDLLKKYHCTQFYIENKGEEESRVFFNKMIEGLKPRDIVVLTSIKEFPLTTLELINQVDKIYKKGAQIKSMDGVNWTEFCILTDFDKFLKSKRNKTGLTGAKP